MTVQPASYDAFRQALGMLGPEPDTAAPLVHALGMRHIRSAVDMVGKYASASELRNQVAEYVEAFYRVGEADLSDGATVGVYLIPLREWETRSSDRERYRRKVAKALVEHQQQDARWLAILLDPRGKSPEVEFVMPRVRPGAGVGTVRASVNLREPNRYHCELLEAMTVPAGASLGAIVKQWNEAFSVERVTKRFYEEFRVLRDQLIDALLECNADNPALKGRDRKKDKEFDLQLHAYGTRQLGRLLFAWFLQQKRWLGNSAGDGDPEFLSKLFAEKRDVVDGFFADTLVPLFLDGLGLPLRDQAHKAVEERLGPIPYLGGALFRAGADDFEATLMGLEGDDLRPTRRVVLPDDLFDPKKDQPATSGKKGSAQRTILGLLRGYRFTTQESTPDDQSVDPDPELLGKVFENLYQADERHQTGAYYTPREIVHYMCRQVLDGYLAERSGISQEDIDRIRSEAADWTLSDWRLDTVAAEKVQHALADVKILDPAVGSGAFLLASIHEIVLLRRGIWQSEHDDFLDRGSQEMADYKRHAATNCVYGVDINPMAVEICQLRLLLSIVVDLDISDYREVPTLPNLDFRVVAGDSLIDRMGEKPFLQSLPPPLGVQFDFELTKQIGDLQKKIDKWRGEFSGEGVERKDAARLRDLAQKIRAAQVEIARIQLDGETEDARARLKKLATSGKATKKALRSLEAHLSGLEQLAEGLHERAAYQKPFLWPVNFHEVFEAGGFDIVLANPPYVRQEKLDATDQVAFAAAFDSVHIGTADLYVYFYERARQVLRTSGMAAFITSDKFMRVDYGVALRRRLASGWQLSHVIDFAHLPVFDADVMPSVIIMKAAMPADDAELGFARLREPIRVSIIESGVSVNVASVRSALENLTSLLSEHVVPDVVQKYLIDEVWAPVSREVVAAVKQMRSAHPTLGEILGSTDSTYGVKTGLNDAYIVTDVERRRLIDEDRSSEQCLRQWGRGQDIVDWAPKLSGLWLILIPSSEDASVNNPWSQAGTEAKARQVFAETYPAVYRHLLPFEDGLRRRSDQGRFWWELRSCAYYAEFAKPKMVWKDIAYRPHFAWDGKGTVFGNTAFFSAQAPKSLVAVCNSLPFYWLAGMTLIEAKDAYYRWLPSDLAHVPTPLLDSDASRQLEAAVNRALENGGLSVEEEVNDLVFDLYGLEESARRAARSWNDLRVKSETVASVLSGATEIE